MSTGLKIYGVAGKGISGLGVAPPKRREPADHKRVVI
jgi:hypothetical protein